MVAPDDHVGDGVVSDAQLDGDLRLRTILVQTRQGAEVLLGNRRRIFLADERVRVRRVT